MNKDFSKFKRLKIALLCLIINFIFFSIAMYMEIDLISVGTGLSLLNAPIYAFILGDSIRKSES